MFLKKQLISDDHITDKAIINYCILNDLSSIRYGTHCINERFLFYSLYKTIPSNANWRILQHFKEGIEELSQLDLVKTQKIGDSWFVNCDSLKFDLSKEHFIVVKFEDIATICKHIWGSKGYPVVRFYLKLLGTINTGIQIMLSSDDVKANVVGHMPINSLTSITGYSKNTVIKYLNILSELKLIYLRQDNKCDHKDNTNEFRKYSNIYGRYEDKDYIDKFIKDRHKYLN